MKFESYGPFELDRTANGMVAGDAASRREYWNWVDEYVPGLSEACGCYVYGIQAPRGTLPWYVGKAEKLSFRRECLTPHKLRHFDSALVGRRGRPVLFFLPQLTANGAFRRPTTAERRAIRELENLLIGMAVARNPDVLNIRGTKALRDLEVVGFINTPRLARSGDAKELRNVFGT